MPTRNADKSYSNMLHRKYKRKKLKKRLKCKNQCPCGSGEKFGKCHGKDVCNKEILGVLLLFHLFAFTPFNLIGQKTVQGNDSNYRNERYEYSADNDIIAYYYKITEKNIDWANMRVIKPGIRFRKIFEIKLNNQSNVETSYTVIQVVRFNVSGVNDSILKKINIDVGASKTVSYLENNQYMVVESNILDDVTKVRKRYPLRVKSGNNHLNIGTLFLPFKIRPGGQGALFSFNSDVSLGGTFGWNFRISHFKPYYLGPFAYIGTSIINVDSSTTNGVVRQSDYQVGAITACLGVVLELDKFQIAAISGFDFIPGTIGQNWMYSNRPWFTIGFGYQFIKKDEK